MKITIEPTTDQSKRDFSLSKVVIEGRDDNENLEEAVELLEAALRAYGFYYAKLDFETLSPQTK